MAKKPRILVYDLETSPNIGAFFKLWEDRIPHTHIFKERYIICASWKWLDEKSISSVSVLHDKDRFDKDPYDDHHVVKTFLNIYSSADIVVTHNGDKFDNRYLKTRALVHDLSPPPPIKSIDTYKIARRVFFFNSNRLDYIGRLLGVGGKERVSPGLWLDVLNGKKKAINEMVKYNRRDVTLLEDVFKKMEPYIPNYPNLELYGETGCPRCGGNRVQSRGTHKTVTREYRRFQCQECGGWFRKVKAEKAITVEHRAL